MINRVKRVHDHMWVKKNMKYFSIGYWSNWNDKDEVGKAYRSYIASIRLQLPAGLQTLSAGGGKDL